MKRNTRTFRHLIAIKKNRYAKHFAKLLTKINELNIQTL